MADTLGNVQIPASASDSPLGDPTLGILLQFFKAALTASLTNVWAVACPNVPVVKTIDARDPEDLSLTTTELPGLFLDRDGYDPIVWQSADYNFVPSRLRLWWVLPRLELKWRRQRSNIVHAATAGLLFANYWTGRVPGLVFPGDDDPVAATKGSLFTKFAKLWSINFGKSGPDKLKLDVDGKKQVFDCVVWNIVLGEKLGEDSSLHAKALLGLQDSIANSGLPLVFVGVRTIPLTGMLGTASSMPGSLEPGYT